MNLELFLAKLFGVQIEDSENIEYVAPILREGINTSIINPDPSNPPWSSWTAIGVWLASMAFMIIFGSIILLPYLMKQNIDFANKAAISEFSQNDPTAIFLQVIATIPAHFLTLILAWIVVTRFKKFSFRQTLGWESGGFAWWYYPLILIGIFLVSAIVSYIIPERDNDMLRILRSSRETVFVVAFLATFTAPLVEEVIYRGILYSAFQRSFGIPIAVLIVTIIFAAIHFYQYWGSPSTIFLICFLSLVLTLVRVRTKNLLPCIILHTTINGIQSIYLVLQPYLNTETAIDQSARLMHLWK